MKTEDLLAIMYGRTHHFAALTLRDGSVVRGFVFTVLNPYDNEDIEDFGDQSVIVMILEDDSLQCFPEGDISDIAPWYGPAWITVSSRPVDERM